MTDRLFTIWKDCPICQARESVAIEPGPANFWRCGECRQAIVERGGRLEPWLDIASAGKKKRSSRDVRRSNR